MAGGVSDGTHRRTGRESQTPHGEPPGYEPLPKRTRARKRIESPPAPLGVPPEESHGRRLSRAERNRLRQQYQGRRVVPDTVRRPSTGRSGRSWLTPVLVIALLAVLGGSIGAGRFLAADPTPTAEPTVSPTPPELAAIVTEPPTETPTKEPTSTPQPTATPEFTPTPDPRFVGKIVCLDVGHGGSDRGFTREETEGAPAMEEAEYNLIFARAVRARLETLGFTVVMTRDSDVDVNAAGEDVNGDGETHANMRSKGFEAAERAKDLDELQARIDICNEAGADLLVSMHMNGFNEDLTVSGYETWFSSSRPFRTLNRLFATLAYDALGEEMAEAGYNARGRGVQDDQDADVIFSGDAFDSYVITGPAQPGKIVPSAMPGAIIEVLFLSNEQDAAFLASTAGRDAVVTAYVRAISGYFEQTEGDI